MKLNKTLTFSLLALSFLTKTHAVQNWFLGSDASGNLISSSDGSSAVTWTGGGTVTPFTSHAPATASSVDLITGMTDGKMSGITTRSLGSASDRLSFDLDIMLLPSAAGAATADFQVIYDAINGGRGFNFTNLQNVRGIHVITTYDQPLSFNTGGAAPRRAWGFAIANRLTDVNYEAKLTLPDVITLSPDIASSTNDPLIEGTDYVRGAAPAGWFSSFDASTSSAGVPSVIGLSTTAHNVSGGSTITYETTADPGFQEWLGLEGIDHNGDGDVFDHDNTTDTPDEQLDQFVYLNTVDWLIESPDGSAFDSTASFNFSMDGVQHTGTVASAISALDGVPEPGTSILAGLAGLGLLARRRR